MVFDGCAGGGVAPEAALMIRIDDFTASSDW